MTIYTKDMKTRSTNSGELKAKGSALTHSEMDANIIAIYNDFKTMQYTPEISVYNAGTTYDNTVNKFARYNSYLWKWIYASSGSGVTPGTDATKWERIMVNEMSHEKDHDTYLDRGGENEISATHIPKYVEITLSSADILSGNEIELSIPNETTKFIDIISVTAESLYEDASPFSTDYNGGNLYLKNKDASENLFEFVDFFACTGNIIRKGVQKYSNGSVSQLIRNKPIMAVCDSGVSPANVTGGDYDVKLRIHYLILE